LGRSRHSVSLAVWTASWASSNVTEDAEGDAVEAVVDGLRQARERCLIPMLRTDHDLSAQPYP
jgi:hypothetical protein